MIFDATQQRLPSFLPLPESGMYSDQHKDWLVLLHVCRHWRGVVASSPSLWSTIDSHLIPHSFLKRSRGLPLTLYLGMRQEGVNKGLIDALIPHSHRFHELHISSALWDAPQPIFSLLSRPAPRLFSLTIDDKGQNGDALAPIFGGEMPVLRQLALKHFTSWPPGYFENLTHLCLYNQEVFSRPSTSSFLDYLEASPLLEDLVLSSAGPTRPDEDDFPVVPSTRIVSLPQLRCLHIDEFPAGPIVSRLLSHLDVPNMSTLHIRYMHSMHSSQPFGSFIPSDFSRLGNVNSITEWQLTRRLRSEFYDPTIIFIGSTLVTDGHFSPSELLELPLNNVREFVVKDIKNPREQFSFRVWGEIFERVPLLATLHICVHPNCLSSPTRTILSALHPQRENESSEPPTNSSPAAICPKLTTLYVHGDPKLPSLYIITLFEERTRRGSPLRTLELSGLNRRSVDPLARYANSINSEDDRADFDDELRSFTSDDVSLLQRYIDSVEYSEDPKLAVLPSLGSSLRYLVWARRRLF